MKKMNIIVLLLLILAGWLYSEELNNYLIIEVNVIPTGKKEGMIVLCFAYRDFNPNP